MGFWDPLGLAADGDTDTFKRRRAAELKHGPLGEVRVGRGVGGGRGHEARQLLFGS